jgi:Fe-S oxidoreductase
MLRGYRGFLRELARTGGWRALSLQLRTGAEHVLRRLRRERGEDPIALFFRNYGADGLRLPDPERARLQLAAEACLVCGLCSVECARVGGAPPLDPRDAVVAAARLEIDWLRLGLAPFAPASADGAAIGIDSPASACATCRACTLVCPAAIPIERVQETLARLGGGELPAAPR